MSRIEHYPNVTATKNNRSTKFPEIPTSGDWESGILDVDYVEIVPNKIIEL